MLGFNDPKSHKVQESLGEATIGVFSAGEQKESASAGLGKGAGIDGSILKRDVGFRRKEQSRVRLQCFRTRPDAWRPEVPS